MRYILFCFALKHCLFVCFLQYVHVIMQFNLTQIHIIYTRPKFIRVTHCARRGRETPLKGL